MRSETFALPDARCAGCVLKIERTLANLPGVEMARGNATQKRIRVIWDETAQTVESLCSTIQSLGYAANAIDLGPPPPRDHGLLRRLGLAAFGMMNIMALSVSVWFGAATDMGAGTAQFFHWLSAAIALPVAVYSGSVFHGPALRAIRHGRMTMDTPISIAIVVTYLASLIETLRGAEHVYFDAVVGLIFFLLIGRVLEQMMHRRSGDAAANLRAFLQVSADRITASGQLETVAAEGLRVGDLVIVKAGNRIPADGRLQTGRALIDQSALTGEAEPRLVRSNGRVAAGTLLLDGPARIEVTGTGAETEIGQMAGLAEEVTGHKGQLQRLSDRFARGYIPLVLGGGFLGFAIWFLILGAGFGQSVLIAVAVLIVTCPCAAGLATPAVTSRAINLALAGGVVVKSGAALERLGDVGQVFLDKTGTASVMRARLPEGTPCEVSRSAQALAAVSAHPLAHALAAGFDGKAAEGAVEIPGQGVRATDGARLGSAAFTGANGPGAQSLWYRAANGMVIPVETEETPRAGLPEFLAKMERQGLPVTLISGDTETAVARFADQAGVKAWKAGLSPTEKLTLIRAAQSGSDRAVMMVGDGINDSVALSGADLSVSFAEANAIAQNAADIVLTRKDIAGLPQVMKLARQSRRLIRQNLAFSLIYNVATIPLALAGLLSPAIAALLMSSSSLVVMVNCLRLRPMQ